MKQRRHLLHLPVAGLAATLAASLPSRALSRDAAELLRAGACGVMIRHALTVPGIGDPPEFRLDRCDTQRNLSEAGRAQSARIGQWFQSRALEPREVFTSQWCRCRDTAEIAFGRFRELPALNSTFQGRGDPPAQIRSLRETLAAIPDGRFDVFVTHQVIITALTGAGTSMGEAVIVDRAGNSLVRVAM